MNKRRRKKEYKKLEVRGFITERMLSRFIEKATAPGTPYGDAIAESFKRSTLFPTNKKSK